ncbi:MAG: DUF4012 domain-containing protein [Microbacteriaceae bacterium]|nr:DUF4012 domain-containing protein [Microbacteriaceae bacterium]
MTGKLWPAPWPARRTIVISIVTLSVALLACAAWVGVRGLLAKTELENAETRLSAIRSAVITGDIAGAQKLSTRLSAETAAASGYTSDVVWRSCEWLPWVGPNLTATRSVATIIDEVDRDAVVPLVRVASSVHLRDFHPVNGAIDLAPLAVLQPVVAKAAHALLLAQQQTRNITTDSTADSVRRAVGRLDTTLQTAVTALSSVDRTLRLLPPMLGAKGPRNYLVLFQTPAELRASGGITGALAVIHTENGRISLAAQATSGDFPHHPQPVLALPAETSALYGDIVGEFIQDVGLTPNFSLTAQLAREMWRLRYGITVDGVITADPVALSYLLNATGPIVLPSGERLTSANAVKLLLSDVYHRFVKPSDQDKFFASAAAAVFGELAKGKPDSVALVKAMGRAGTERRILIWSAHPEEQAVLTDTTFAGGLPVSTAKAKRFGVYFNDATGAKMDRYLSLTTGVTKVECRKDHRPQYNVRVTLTNTLPVNEVNSLPEYVSGGALFGVPLGSVKTLISVYGAPDTTSLSVSRDGAPTGYRPTLDTGYPVNSVGIQLAPGQSTELVFSWLGKAPFSGQILTEGNPVENSNLLVTRGNMCVV